MRGNVGFHKLAVFLTTNVIQKVHQEYFRIGVKLFWLPDIHRTEVKRGRGSLERKKGQIGPPMSCFRSRHCLCRSLFSYYSAVF